MFVPNHRLDPTTEVLAGNDVVQMDWNFWNLKGMISSGHAPAHVSKQLIVRIIQAMAVSNRNAAKALNKEQGIEYIFECRNLRSESGKSAAGWAGFLFSAFEQPTRDLFLAL